MLRTEEHGSFHRAPTANKAMSIGAATQAISSPRRSVGLEQDDPTNSSGVCAPEMQIMKYRQFMLLIDDEGFRRTAREKIAELEQKLREIDE